MKALYILIYRIAAFAVPVLGGVYAYDLNAHWAIRATVFIGIWYTGAAVFGWTAEQLGIDLDEASGANL